MKRAHLLALALSALACASRPPPPPAPSLTSPADALPADLDLVVRVDLEKVRTALGPAGIELMRRGTGALPSDPGTALVTKALERTTTGRGRAADFTWESTARKTLAAIEASLRVESSRRS